MCDANRSIHAILIYIYYNFNVIYLMFQKFGCRVGVILFVIIHFF